MIEDDAPSVTWQTSAIINTIQQTPTIKSFFFRLAQPFSYTAGQHVDVRLTAPNGYVAMRSYSIASSPSDTGIIELAIERLSDGEVSPFFHDVAAVGDEIELRGPLGGHFLWPERATAPVLLIGAGSGLAPLMAMIRQRRALAQSVATALLLSARTKRDVLFAEELFKTEAADQHFHLALAITRDRPERSADFNRRIDSAIVADVVGRLPAQPGDVFICGSNGFVNIAADGALAAGLPAGAVRTERYGG